MAEQAKILCDEAEENNLGYKAMVKRFERWHTCSLCEQHYHSVVACALGWACWKAYVGRPEADNCRMNAMNQLGSGLFDAQLYVDASSVRETELANAHPTTVQIGLSLKSSRAELRAHEAQGEAQDAFRTARLKLAQERSELAQTLASDYDEPD